MIRKGRGLSSLAGGHKGRPHISGVLFPMGCLVALICRAGLGLAWAGAQGRPYIFGNRFDLMSCGAYL